MPQDVQGAAWQYCGCGGRVADARDGKAVYKPHTEISKISMVKVPKFGTAGEDIVAYLLDRATPPRPRLCLLTVDDVNSSSCKQLDS